jgi:hypothetical protein
LDRRSCAGRWEIAFLDEHRQCAMCFHNAIVVRDDGAEPPREFNPQSLPVITELQDLLKGNYIAGCSAMIRRDTLQEIPTWYEHANYGDWPLYVFAAQRGSIGFLPAIMGAYRVHDKGLWWSATRDRQIQGIIQFYNAISAHLGLSILPILARHYVELGVVKKNARKYAEAVEYLVTSVRLRPFTSEIRRGRRARHLARLAICGLLGVGMTPRAACSGRLGRL